MAAYRIEFVKTAEKEFARLPIKTRSKVTEALSLLAQNPYSELLNVKKLKGVENVFRFRIGDYRVAYEIRSKTVVVVVVKIANRKDLYR